MNCSNCGNQLVPGVKFCSKCGAPVITPPSAYMPPSVSAPPPQMQASWNPSQQAAGAQPPRKSRLGKVLLILFAVFVLGLAGVGVAGYYGFRYVESNLKSSEAYRMAVAELTSKAAADALGEIKSTGFPIGSFKEEGDGSGGAAFTMSVEGTKASGQYFVVMQREQGAWRIERAVVKLEDGNVVNLVEEQSGAHTSPFGNGNLPPGFPQVNLPPPPPVPPGSDRSAISGGMLNGKAISKPAPAYPPLAKAAHASGTVIVAVTVDESGSVVEAHATSGHPLLQAAAVAAAREAQFTPTMLKGKPVKVGGILTYEFKLE